jgi:CBS domain-containing protein
MLTKIKVSDYMSTTLVTLTESTNIFEAIKTMAEARITSAPVINEASQMVGIFSERDCMNAAICATYNQVAGGGVGEYMSSGIMSIKAESSILEAANQFNSSHIRSLPVYDDVGLVGIISRTDVLRAIATFH